MVTSIKRLKYVHGFVDRRSGGAKARYYFRRAGFKRVPLPGVFGSAEFMAAYAAALAGQTPIKIGSRRVKRGTIAAMVVTYLTSPKFLSKSLATQATTRTSWSAFVQSMATSLSPIWSGSTSLQCSRRRCKRQPQRIIGCGLLRA
jgi:hypothetical protein